LSETHENSDSLFRPNICAIFENEDEEHPDQTLGWTDPLRTVAERIFAKAENDVKASCK